MSIQTWIFIVSIVRWRTDKTSTVFEIFPIGCEFDNDTDVIISWLDKIVAEQLHSVAILRQNGHYSDVKWVLPIDVGNRILYCLRLSVKIFVFDYGGVKDVPTSEESNKLVSYVKHSINTSRFISSRIKNGTVYWWIKICLT